MRTQRVARWGGSILSPRTRGSPAARVQTTAPHTRRFQSTAAVAREDVGDEQQHFFNPIPPSQQPYRQLVRFPSPPIHAARNSPKLAALHARLQLPKRLPLETLAKCLVHPSADADSRFNNTSLAMLGNNILGYHCSELILCTYPRLPLDVVFESMAAYVGPDACIDLVRSWGVEMAGQPGGEVDAGLMQFLHATVGNKDVGGDGTLYKDVMAKEKAEREASRTWAGFQPSPNRMSISDSYFGAGGYGADGEAPSPIELAERPELQNVSDQLARDRLRVQPRMAASEFVRALFGAIYLHAGRDAAKEFFNAHIRSRKLDVSRMFYFKQPTRDLGQLCAREGFEKPVGRILSETGRYSRTPVFVVGVFSGREKLGEGTGSSLDEARIRAAISALKGWYLYSPVKVMVPSDMEGKRDKAWQPALIDGGEVIV